MVTLVYHIRFHPKAVGELEKLDRTSQERIATYLSKNIQGKNNPRESGKPLRGGKVKLWRYRVGDYRVVCKINDAEKIVLVLRIGHRKEVYRQP